MTPASRQLGQSFATRINISLLINALRPRSHGTGSVWSRYQFEKSQDEHDS